jgi:preprotein translocase subunit YajC
MLPLVIILILLLVGYLVLIRPTRRRQASHEAMQDSVEVGDEIITAGGIHGTVKAAEADALRVEIAPSVVVRLDRRAVAAVAQEEPSSLEQPQTGQEGRQGAS